MRRKYCAYKRENGTWSIVRNDPHNKWELQHKPIKINWDQPIKGTTSAMGTNSNYKRASHLGIPLSHAKENYQGLYGETVYDRHNQPQKVRMDGLGSIL